MRARLSSAFDALSNIRALSHREAAGQFIRKVDILIDLKGYTITPAGDIGLSPSTGAGELSRLPRHHGGGFHRLHHRRPVRRPAGQQPFFAERLVQLPGSYQVNDTRREVAMAGTSRQDHGLPAEGLVFCSFNNSYKISPVSSISGCVCCGRFRTACYGCSRRTSRSEANLRSEAENAVSIRA